MNSDFILEDVPDESLDAVLAMEMENKIIYFSNLIEHFYPDLSKEDDQYTDLLELYISSFYVEKLYRSNRFFNEKFTPIYTMTGLIRDISADMFLLDNDLSVH
jgi:hypothetical protein